MFTGRSKKVFVTQIIICIIVLVSVMLFSLEPTMDFYIQNTIEQQYSDLELFKQMYSALNFINIKEKDLKYVIMKLEGLKNRNNNFILKDDVDLLLAKAYGCLGNRSKTKEILLSMLKDSGDSLSKTDAMLQMASLYENDNLLQKAVQIIETNKNQNRFYKKNEVNFMLSRLYYQLNKTDISGKYLVNVDKLDDEFVPYFCKIIVSEWDNYTRIEKKKILKTLSKVHQYEEYSCLADKYIRQYRPDYQETENIAYDIVYNCRQPFVKDFLFRLKEDIEYLPIYKEMMDLFSLSKNTIQSRSGLIRGSYYYKLLWPISRKARYNDKKALDYYNKYLSGDVDITYINKNLPLAVRNLLAFKKYADITNIIEDSYSVLNMDLKSGNMSDYICFWNGYSAYMLNDKNKAKEFFESSISKIPDGYYAILSRAFIDSILQEKNLSENDYINSIQERYKNNSDINSRLYYGRLLYSYKKGIERESIREDLIELTKKIDNNVLLDFNSGVLNRIKNNENNIKFIVYTRFGMLERARAILTSADISDVDEQNLLILKELVKNKNFELARSIYIDLEKSEFINENFSILSRDLQILLYPQPYESEIKLALSKLETSFSDKYLIYSVIRGESMYIPLAKSSAGARGLMQIMPSTARLVSNKILERKNINLFNTSHNILLGTKFLNDSIESYGLLTAIASYNGGIRIINKTIQKFYPGNEYELMEIVPYSETREYIKKILVNYYRYKNIYDFDGWDVKLVTTGKLHA